MKWCIPNLWVFQTVGSADKAAEGKYYVRSTRLLKQSYKTVVRFRIMNILENLPLDDTVTRLIGKIRVDPSPSISRVSYNISELL